MRQLFWLCFGCIFYTYVGYPLLLTVLAGFRSRVKIYKPITPYVTLLIAAHNEQAIIAKKLQNSLSLDYPRDKLQILVTADGSNDCTPDIVQEFANSGVELAYLPPRRGKIAAINRALPLVRGDIILLSDANNMYQPEVVRELVAPFADPSVGITTGSKSIITGDGALGDSEGLYWKYESFIKTQETKLGCCAAVAGEIMAVRRTLFEPQPEHLLTEDTHLAMQVIGRGYRVLYVPQARSFERVSASAQDEITRRSRIFVGRYQELMMVYKALSLHRPVVAWQVLSHQSLRTLVPIAMLGVFITNLFAVVWPVRATRYPLRDLVSPINWIMLILQFVFYGLAWLGSRTAHRGLVGKIVYLPTFMVNLNMAGLMGLYRFLTGKHTPLWKRAQRRG